ncbi:hypothetical protein GCM10009578_070600 [Streptomyces rhizosphaericus]
MDGRSITVKATHGACDDGPVVKALETSESIVLYASVAGARSGACSSEMIEQSVRVQMRKPLGDRILLDALSGQPVPHGEPDGLSPSWTKGDFSAGRKASGCVLLRTVFECHLLQASVLSCLR